MIKINRPTEVPTVLLTRGADETTLLCGEYDGGKREFDFKASIYAHASVKQALVEAQHKKCCFCEHKAGPDGDVEHFRPKAGSCQSKGRNLLKPGYYWLAYDWSNLFLCCSACNQRFKRNLFPLADASKRARCHIDKLSDEEPLFLNPAEDDPEEHIAFRREIPYPRNGSRRGRHTIEALGLDREIINERRRDDLQKLEILASALRLLCVKDRPSDEERETINGIAHLLAESQSASSAHASMARCAAVDGNWAALIEMALTDRAD